jgi:hypothetical protein
VSLARYEQGKAGRRGQEEKLVRREPPRKVVPLQTTRKPACQHGLQLPLQIPRHLQVQTWSRWGVVSSEGSDKLSLCQLCHDCINDLWIPAHLDEEQAAAFALDWLRRAVLAEVGLLEVSTAVGQRPTA